MSFRKFGGLQYAAKHNIVSSNYNTSNNLTVTEKVGQPNSDINFESNIYLDGDLHILATGPTGSSSNNGIYFPDGSFQNTAANTSGQGINGVTGVYSNGIENGAQITTNHYLQLGAATQFYPGVVTTNSQSFSGQKSFDSDILVQNSMTVGYGGRSSSIINPYNTALGYYALSSNTNNSTIVAGNVAIGYQALKKTTSGTDNISIGANSLFNNKTGSSNISIGTSALVSTTDSSHNIGIGYYALTSDASGILNLGIGSYSLFKNKSGKNNIAIGYKALYWNTAGANLALGNNALYTNSTGYYNLAIGSGAVYCNTSGTYNMGIGLSSLYYNTTGNNNVGLGFGTLFNNTTGSYNVGLGVNSLYNNTTGSNNVALGYSAGPKTSNVSNSIAIGYQAETTVSNTIKLGNSSIIQMNTHGTIGVGTYASDTDASGITGSIYYNNTNSVLKVYDGSSWSTIGTSSGGPTGPTGTIGGVTSISSSGLAYGATTTTGGLLQFAYSNGLGTPGLQPGSYSDIFSTQNIDLGVTYPNGNFGSNWAITTALQKNWNSVSLSSSGQYQTAVAGLNYIYVSSDYGNSWVAKTNVSQNWSFVSVSASGQYQTAGLGDGYIYISSDFGNNWTEITTNLVSGFWASIALSSSGQYQTAIMNDGYIYISSDYGNNWTEVTSAGSRQWTSNAISSSGQYQTALYDSGYIYISSDFGNNWTELTSAGLMGWYKLAISSSGQYQTIGTASGYIYISNDYGNNWSEITNSGSTNWGVITMSSSGRYQAAIDNFNNYIYISTDYGNNWSEIISIFSGLYGLTSISMSSSGQYITITEGGRYIYTCYNAVNTKGVLSAGNYTSTSGVTGIAGSIYYDTTSNAMKYSDGTQWQSFGITGPAGPLSSTPDYLTAALIYQQQDLNYANITTLTQSNLCTTSTSSTVLALGTTVNLNIWAVSTPNRINYANNQIIYGSPSIETFIYASVGSTTSAFSDSTLYQPTCIHFSADGNYGYALGDNYGANSNIIYAWDGTNFWHQYTTLSSNHWVSCALSSNGNYQAICGKNSGALYISSDYGVSWTNVQSGEWYSVSMSATGQYITAVSQYDNVYVSNDYGKTFSGNINNTRAWASCCMNATGQYQLALANDGTTTYYIYYSKNYGVTWSQPSYFPLYSSALWSSCAMNPTGNIWIVSKTDGTYIIGLLYGGTFIQTSSGGGTNSILSSINFSGSYLTCINSSNYPKYIQFSVIN